MTAARPLPKRTREALAACEAVGLSYWSDAPAGAHVWAVDDCQRAHLVHINRKAGTARHVCCPADSASECAGWAQQRQETPLTNTEGIA